MVALWKNAFVNSLHGRLCMLAALRAVLEKWDNTMDFFAPVSADNRVPYYAVTALLYTLVVLKVSGKMTVATFGV